MDYEGSKYNYLDQMLVDANKEPTDLPLSLLKAITDNFSEDRKIGTGGFAVVYEGLLWNGSVAVKRLFQAVDLDEKNFNQEVTSLIHVKHKNIVRFLGYCADTQGKVEKYNGKMIMADVRQRLLCFEFLPNGSLDEHISDSSRGLEWTTRYQIIKGICEGLHYLHQQKIVHLDLKPANILLDYYMVPKIADFGLSKCFDEKQTRAITSKVIGSQGYMAPEFYSGVITFKSDIYSLGIIITELLTGQKGYLQIENVLEGWSTRFQKLWKGCSWLEHVRVCAEIGIKCINANPTERPFTGYIIETLDELEHTYGFVETDISAANISNPVPKLSDKGQGQLAGASAAPFMIPKGPGKEHETKNSEQDSLKNAELGRGLTSIVQIISNEDLKDLREMGSGAFGTVFHGKWKGTDVAIKRIKNSCFMLPSPQADKLITEFWREAAIMSKLHHPNILAFYGVVNNGPGATLATVTEFLVNGSLKKALLRKDKYLDWRRRIMLAMDAAIGMEYLHSKDIVHFDLKCDNLLVSVKDPSRPICKVADFGLSKMKQATLVSGGMRGTLPWMAPELLTMSGTKVSEKIDVYSFGIVMWEILTGKDPYDGMHYGGVIGGILSNTLRPPVPTSCNPEWRELMEQCWSTEPERRPSFTEVASRLRAILEGSQRESPS